VESLATNCFTTATAVSRVDNLEFLSDVIPKTTTYKQFKEKKAKERKIHRAAVQKGQTTLTGKKPEARTNKGIEHMLNAKNDDPLAKSGVGENPAKKSGIGAKTGGGESRSQTTTIVDRTVESPRREPAKENAKESEKEREESESESEGESESGGDEDEDDDTDEKK
jgi:DNA-directed RNA polymerase I subunit RPA43